MAEFEPFKPAPWLKNAHLQTLWPFFFRFHPRPSYQRERVELPDGDFIDIDWLSAYHESRPKAVVLLIHGLQGSSQSHYIRGIGAALCAAGFMTAALNFRGRSGEMNRLAIFGHAGHTDDVDFIIGKLSKDHPDQKIAILGVSLGASMLINWLARGKNVSQRVHSAAVISTPFLLSESAKRMSAGFSRVYQYYLISNLKSSVRQKLKKMPMPGILNRWPQSKTFFDFDDAVTARLHGFRDVHDYYQQASTKNLLPAVTTPLLIIQSRDDPFMSADVIPPASDVNANTKLEIYDSGGHAGFVGSRKGKPFYWLDKRIVHHFEQTLGICP